VAQLVGSLREVAHKELSPFRIAWAKIRVPNNRLSDVRLT